MSATSPDSASQQQHSERKQQSRQVRSGESKTSSYPSSTVGGSARFAREGFGARSMSGDISETKRGFIMSDKSSPRFSFAAKAAHSRGGVHSSRRSPLEPSPAREHRSDSNNWRKPGVSRRKRDRVSGIGESPSHSAFSAARPRHGLASTSESGVHRSSVESSSQGKQDEPTAVITVTTALPPSTAMSIRTSSDGSSTSATPSTSVMSTTISSGTNTTTTTTSSKSTSGPPRSSSQSSAGSLSPPRLRAKTSSRSPTSKEGGSVAVSSVWGQTRATGALRSLGLTRSKSSDESRAVEGYSAAKKAAGVAATKSDHGASVSDGGTVSDSGVGSMPMPGLDVHSDGVRRSGWKPSLNPAVSNGSSSSSVASFPSASTAGGSRRRSHHRRMAESADISGMGITHSSTHSTASISQVSTASKVKASARVVPGSTPGERSMAEVVAGADRKSKQPVRGSSSSTTTTTAAVMIHEQPPSKKTLRTSHSRNGVSSTRVAVGSGSAAVSARSGKASSKTTSPIAASSASLSSRDTGFMSDTVIVQQSTASTKLKKVVKPPMKYALAVASSRMNGTVRSGGLAIGSAHGRKSGMSSTVAAKPTGTTRMMTAPQTSLPAHQSGASQSHSSKPATTMTSRGVQSYTAAVTGGLHLSMGSSVTSMRSNPSSAITSGVASVAKGSSSPVRTGFLMHPPPVSGAVTGARPIQGVSSTITAQSTAKHSGTAGPGSSSSSLGSGAAAASTVAGDSSDSRPSSFSITISHTHHVDPYPNPISSRSSDDSAVGSVIPGGGPSLSTSAVSAESSAVPLSSDPRDLCKMEVKRRRPEWAEGKLFHLIHKCKENVQRVSLNLDIDDHYIRLWKMLDQSSEASASSQAASASAPSPPGSLGSLAVGSSVSSSEVSPTSASGSTSSMLGADPSSSPSMNSNQAKLLSDCRKMVDFCTKYICTLEWLECRSHRNAIVLNFAYFDFAFLEKIYRQLFFLDSSNNTSHHRRNHHHHRRHHHSDAASGVSTSPSASGSSSASGIGVHLNPASLANHHHSHATEVRISMDDSTLIGGVSSEMKVPSKMEECLPFVYSLKLSMSIVEIMQLMTTKFTLDERQRSHLSDIKDGAFGVWYEFWSDDDDSFHFLSLSRVRGIHDYHLWKKRKEEEKQKSAWHCRSGSYRMHVPSIVLEARKRKAAAVEQSKRRKQKEVWDLNDELVLLEQVLSWIGKQCAVLRHIFVGDPLPTKADGTNTNHKMSNPMRRRNTVSTTVTSVMGLRTRVKREYHNLFVCLLSALLKIICDASSDEDSLLMAQESGDYHGVYDEYTLGLLRNAPMMHRCCNILSVALQKLRELISITEECRNPHLFNILKCALQGLVKSSVDDHSALWEGGPASSSSSPSPSSSSSSSTTRGRLIQRSVCELMTLFVRRLSCFQLDSDCGELVLRMIEDERESETTDDEDDSTAAADGTVRVTDQDSSAVAGPSSSFAADQPDQQGSDVIASVHTRQSSEPVALLPPPTAMTSDSGAVPALPPATTSISQHHSQMTHQRYHSADAVWPPLYPLRPLHQPPPAGVLLAAQAHPVAAVPAAQSPLYSAPSSVTSGSVPFISPQMARPHRHSLPLPAQAPVEPSLPMASVVRAPSVPAAEATRRGSESDLSLAVFPDALSVADYSDPRRRRSASIERTSSKTRNAGLGEASTDRGKKSRRAVNLSHKRRRKSVLLDDGRFLYYESGQSRRKHLSRLSEHSSVFGFGGSEIADDNVFFLNMKLYDIPYFNHAMELMNRRGTSEAASLTTARSDAAGLFDDSKQSDMFLNHVVSVTKSVMKKWKLRMIYMMYVPSANATKKQVKKTKLTMSKSTASATAADDENVESTVDYPKPRSPMKSSSAPETCTVAQSSSDGGSGHESKGSKSGSKSRPSRLSRSVSPRKDGLNVSAPVFVLNPKSKSFTPISPQKRKLDGKEDAPAPPSPSIKISLSKVDGTLDRNQGKSEMKITGISSEKSEEKGLITKDAHLFPVAPQKSDVSATVDTADYTVPLSLEDKGSGAATTASSGSSSVSASSDPAEAETLGDVVASFTETDSAEAKKQLLSHDVLSQQDIISTIHQLFATARRGKGESLKAQEEFVRQPTPKLSDSQWRILRRAKQSPLEFTRLLVVFDCANLVDLPPLSSVVEEDGSSLDHGIHLRSPLDDLGTLDESESADGESPKKKKKSSLSLSVSRGRNALSTRKSRGHGHFHTSHGGGFDQNASLDPRRVRRYLMRVCDEIVDRVMFGAYRLRVVFYPLNSIVSDNGPLIGGSNLDSVSLRSEFSDPQSDRFVFSGLPMSDYLARDLRRQHNTTHSSSTTNSSLSGGPRGSSGLSSSAASGTSSAAVAPAPPALMDPVPGVSVVIGLDHYTLSKSILALSLAKKADLKCLQRRFVLLLRLKMYLDSVMNSPGFDPLTDWFGYDMDDDSAAEITTSVARQSDLKSTDSAAKSVAVTDGSSVSSAMISSVGGDASITSVAADLDDSSEDGDRIIMNCQCDKKCNKSMMVLNEERQHFFYFVLFGSIACDLDHSKSDMDLSVHWTLQDEPLVSHISQGTGKKKTTATTSSDSDSQMPSHLTAQVSTHSAGISAKKSCHCPCSFCDDKQIRRRRLKRMSPHIILGPLAAALSRDSSLETKYISHATVPVIKITHKSTGLQSDISCVPSKVSKTKSRLMFEFVRADWRIRPLVLAIKEWVKSRKLDDAYRGHINSFGYTIMVLHYLRWVSANAPSSSSLSSSSKVSVSSVVSSADPSLSSSIGSQSSASGGRRSRRSGRHKSGVISTAAAAAEATGSSGSAASAMSSRSDGIGHSHSGVSGKSAIERKLISMIADHSLGALYCGFFRYYSAVFDPSKHAISCLHDRLLEKREVVPKLKAKQNRVVIISDPCDIAENVARRVTELTLEQLTAELNRADGVLNGSYLSRDSGGASAAAASAMGVIPSAVAPASVGPAMVMTRGGHGSVPSVVAGMPAELTGPDPSSLMFAAQGRGPTVPTAMMPNGSQFAPTTMIPPRPPNVGGSYTFF